jgi:acetyl esterase/lipase
VRIDPTIPVEHVAGVQFAQVDGRALLMDVVYSAGRLHGEPDGPRPAVLLMGSPWTDGVRPADQWFQPYLATHGFVVISADVRSFVEAPFPAQLHDVKAAIRWLRARAGAYGIDPQRIGIWGASIGATLAALVGLTGDSGVPEIEGASGSPGHSTRVQAAVWASGGADFPRQWAEKRWQRPHLTQVFGGPVDEHLELARLASPLHHARRHAPGAPPPPPFLLLHGTRDETTPFEPAVLLYEALCAAGGTAELVPLLGRYHNWTGLIENPDERWRYWDLAPMALSFLVKHLRP